MTRAILFRNPDDSWAGFQISGHSGYGEEGADIVCAGISALTITCVNAMESICGIQMAVNGGEDGFLEAMLPRKLTSDKQHDAQLLLAVLHQGLKDLAETYPEYLTMHIQKRRNSP